MRRSLALAAVAVAFVTGCSSGGGEAASPSSTLGSSENASPTEAAAEVEASPTPSETPSEPAPAAEWADHGYIHKAIGEVAGMTDANGASILSLTVDSVTPSATCPEPTADPSANGMYVAVQITATTSPGWGTDEFGEFRVTQYDIKAFQGNTLVPDPTNGGNAAWCGGSTPDPALGTNQSATWTVYIDVPTDTTSIAIVPGGLGDGGWEWLVPSA